MITTSLALCILVSSIQGTSIEHVGENQNQNIAQSNEYTFVNPLFNQDLLDDLFSRKKRNLEEDGIESDLSNETIYDAPMITEVGTRDLVPYSDISPELKTLANKIEDAANSDNYKENLIAVAEDLESTRVCDTYTVEFIMSSSIHGLILRTLLTITEILTFGGFRSYLSSIILAVGVNYVAQQFFGVNFLSYVLDAALDLIGFRFNAQSILLLLFLLYHIYNNVL